MEKVLLVAALASGCASVPTVRFVDEDAGVASPDASTATVDSGSKLDASGEAEAAVTGCPTPLPAGATCCQGRLCLNNCSQQQCNKCPTTCSGSTVCCPGPGNSLTCSTGC